MQPIDWEVVLGDLARARPVFHSEADLQHALAWSIRATSPTYDVRLEVRYPVPLVHGHRERVDVLVHTPGGAVAVEVKYLTARAQLRTDSGEVFDLADHGARDRRSFDVVLDIARVEHMVRTGFARAGAVVVLTNDPAYWTPAATTRPTGAQAFRLHEGRDLGGVLVWGEQAGPGTRGGHDQVELTGGYRLRWKGFSSLPDVRRGEFRSLVIPVR